MKNKDIISALLGILIMALTYWLLFYQFSPIEHKQVKTLSSLPHTKSME
ncbi:hypothetical protein ACS5PU_12135 [Pedobacter sp. GSP4]